MASMSRAVSSAADSLDGRNVLELGACDNGIAIFLGPPLRVFPRLSGLLTGKALAPLRLADARNLPVMRFLLGPKLGVDFLAQFLGRAGPLFFERWNLGRRLRRAPVPAPGACASGSCFLARFGLFLSVP